MTSVMILGCDLYHIINWFFVYSMFGWAFESTYCSIKGGELVNRGFVTGPVCPIYGAGGVCIYVILHNFPDNLIVYYFAGLVIATIIEYMTAVIMEKLFQTRWWDYSQNPFNFQGRICLGSSIAWGFFAVILMEFIHPFVAGLVDSYPVKEGEIAILIIIILFAIDFTISTINAIQLSGKLAMLTSIYSSATEYFGNTKVGMGFENAKSKIDAVVNESIKENINPNLESLNKVIMTKIDQATELYYKVKPATEEGRETIIPKLKESAGKYASMLTKSNFFQNRVLHAYPQMKSVAAGGQEQLNRIKEVLKVKVKNIVTSENNSQDDN